MGVRCQRQRSAASNQIKLVAYAFAWAVGLVKRLALDRTLGTVPEASRQR